MKNPAPMLTGVLITVQLYGKLEQIPCSNCFGQAWFCILGYHIWRFCCPSGTPVCSLIMPLSGGSDGTHTACPACFGPFSGLRRPPRGRPPWRVLASRPPKRAITPPARHRECCSRTGGGDGSRPAEARKSRDGPQAEYAADGKRVDRCGVHPCHRSAISARAGRQRPRILRS